MAIALIAILCVPSSMAMGITDNTGPAPTPRGEYNQPAPVEVELKATGGMFSNATFNLTIPSNATVLSASLDLEGKPVIGPTQSHNGDFSDQTNNQVYKGTLQEQTPTKKPSTYQGDTFTSYEYSYISASDDSRAQQWAYGWQSPPDYAFHHFKFKVPFDITTKVTATYEGFGGYTYYGGTGYISAWIWNNGTSTWEIIGSGTGYADTLMTKTFTGNGTYADQYKCVHIIAVGRMSGSMYGYDYNCVNTDWCKIYAEGNVLTYPLNPSMDIGGNGKIEWSLVEPKFNYIVNIGDVMLMNEIQALVKSGTAQNVDLKVKFMSNSIGRIRVTNFKVVYNAAPWCTQIPETFSFPEDTDALKLINLNNYFTDDRDTNKLTFEILSEEDTKKVDAELNADGFSLDFKTPANNWWGILKFQVRATDSDGLVRDSNFFRVQVTPVNDAPVITALGKQIATQGQQFNLQVRARDVDQELDPDEKILFADNTSLFDINSEDGKATFTPKQEQVGIFNLMITATDNAGAIDYENFTLDIQDAEDLPKLESIQDQIAVEGQLFSLNAAAADPDTPYGDVLTYSDNCPLFQIDPVTGMISFTPAAKDIGTYKVTLTVTDARAGSDYKDFTLTVQNSMGTMNRPPSIEPIASQTATEDAYFELNVKASDPDLELGDVLTFTDSCPAFDISSAGRISFKPVTKDAGTYNVKITVKDREGLYVETEFQFVIKKANHAPKVTSITPKDGSRVTMNKAVGLQAFASDPDGDRLNYTWKDGENVLGYGGNITTTFSDPGTYIITLIISDGQLQITNETSLEVLEPGTGGRRPPNPSATPGFELFGLMGALVVAIAAISRRKK